MPPTTTISSTSGGSNGKPYFKRTGSKHRSVDSYDQQRQQHSYDDEDDDDDDQDEDDDDRSMQHHSPTSSSTQPTTAAAAASSSMAAGSTKRKTKGSSATQAKKVKKIPACDACKHRRVLCHPVPAPGSCSRCVDKGVRCVTTPVVRKKPAGRTGKRIEESRVMFGAADPALPTSVLPSATPWIASRVATTAPSIPEELPTPPLLESYSPSGNINNRLARIELTGVVASHLIGLYQLLPQSWLPLFPRNRLFLQFEAVGCRLDALPPHAEILAHVIIALTSRVSSHPLLFSPGPPAPPFESINTSALSLPNKDLRIFGRRRQAACERLREKAVRVAAERGAMVDSSEDSMATCFLLEMLEERREGKAGRAYGSAFVSHLRALLDRQEEEGSPMVMNQSLGWSSLIMREALMAAVSGRTAHFTMCDDRLLCGDPAVSLEEALMQSVEDVDVRDSVTLFFRPMRPYTFHVAALARECSDKLTGTYSRRHPLNEAYLAKFLTSLDSLNSLLVVLGARIALILSPVATLAHALPPAFEEERQYIMKACLYTLQLGWSSLSLPVYLDLKRRIELLKSGPISTAGERRRGQERFEVLLRQVYRTTLTGARIVARAVHEAPSLAFLTHLQQERLEIWVPILMEARVVEDGGEGITRREKIIELGWLLDGLKMIGWSWPDSSDLIETLDSTLQSLHLEELLKNTSSASSSTIPAGGSDTNAFVMTPSLFQLSSEMGMDLIMRSRHAPSAPYDPRAAASLQGQRQPSPDYASYFPPVSPGMSSFTNHLQGLSSSAYIIDHSSGNSSSAREDGLGDVETPTGTFDFDALLNGSGNSL